MDQPSNLQKLTKAIQTQANPEKALLLQRYFKTAPGQYAAGDRFLGLTVPTQRTIARHFHNLPFEDLRTLIRSPFHEVRLITLLILIEQFETTGRPPGTKSLPSHPSQPELVQFYLDSTEFINNWDLVDLSAPRILGKFLYQNYFQNLVTTNSTITRQTLYTLVKSKNLWERRISIISTLYLIKNGNFDDALKLSENLLSDKHDLIHKAVGWVLREIGKKDPPTLDSFLQKHYHQMPRTMLRYAIEKHPEDIRQKYLKGTI